MGLFSRSEREAEIKVNEERLEHLERHGWGHCDAARTARSNIRWQTRMIAEEADED